MSPDEFWHGRAELPHAYKEAYKLSREREEIAEWRRGFYTTRAIAAAFSEKSPYPERPLFLSNENVKEERAKARMEADLMKMEAYTIAFNEKFKGE